MKAEPPRDYGASPPRIVAGTIAAVLVGAAIHLDWHMARHHLHLSLGWREHWLSALPLFGFLAWWVARTWPARRWTASVLILGGGILLGQVIEPLWENVSAGAWRIAMSPDRWRAFAMFIATGLAAFAAVMALRAKRSPD